MDHQKFELFSPDGNIFLNSCLRFVNVCQGALDVSLWYA